MLYCFENFIELTAIYLNVNLNGFQLFLHKFNESAKVRQQNLIPIQTFVGNMSSEFAQTFKNDFVYKKMTTNWSDGS